MSFYILWGSLEIGLVFSLVALGVFITFRVLNFPDLTVDGSFPLGGAVAATLISRGHDPFLATAIATAAGAVAGVLTGWLNVSLKIMDLLAGILVMIALYSINLRVMGGPNVPLISEPVVFSLLPGWGPDYIERPLALLALVLLIKLLLDRFFASARGLALRATGANPRMARAQGVDTGSAVLLGMAISNALVALAGRCLPRARGRRHFHGDRDHRHRPGGRHRGRGRAAGAAHRLDHAGRGAGGRALPAVRGAGAQQRRTGLAGAGSESGHGHSGGGGAGAATVAQAAPGARAGTGVRTGTDLHAGTGAAGSSNRGS